MEIGLRQLDILTVIFDSDLRSLTRSALESEGHRVLESSDYLQATSMLISGADPDVVFIECKRSFSSNYGFHQLLKRVVNERLILVSGHTEQDRFKQEKDLEIKHFLVKPVLPSEIKSIVADLHRVIESKSFITKKDTPAWWALYTSHRHEKAVARTLQAKGFEVFLPLCQSIRRWTDRQKVLSLPLFPGYVFVRGGLTRRVEVMTTPGVQMILFHGERVAIIPEIEIQAIQQMTRGPYYAEPHPYLQCGERVQVQRGVLAGVDGILVRKKNLYRLILSVELLARSVAVEIDAADLEPMDSQVIVSRCAPGQIAGNVISDEQSLRSA
jgi:transcription antitermination factor NusG